MSTERKSGTGDERSAEVLISPVTPDGVSLIAAERRRQVTEEGWTPEHDAGHTTGELARAAACYAQPAEARELRGRAANVSASRGAWYEDIPDDWPWHPGYWKPRPDDRVHELVKAGALIAAEIDRLRQDQP